MTKRKKSPRTSLFRRGLSLAKLGIETGQLVARRVVRTALKEATESELAHSALMIYAQKLTKELGAMKGSAMKVGQLLSTYGEYFLPAEVNAILKNLQHQSSALPWIELEPLLLDELGQNKLDQLQIDKNPWASASIGQVHRATIKATDQEVALKIQYPEIERAIDLDLLFLKGLLKVTPLIPKGPELDAILSEVKTMLHRETDYQIEAEATKKVANLVAGDHRYRVPQVFDNFSTKRILATEFLKGSAIDSLEVRKLSLERRNRLGKAFLEHYLRELLIYRFVQTDAHLGNFQIEIDPLEGADRLILFDFGAMRGIEPDFLRNFFKVFKGSLLQDRQLVYAGGLGLGLLERKDEKDLVDRYTDLCFLITEPFADPAWNFAPASLMQPDGVYDWMNSDLPHRVAKQGLRMTRGQPLRAPPAPTIFLDRKMGGTFIFLKVLGCQFNSRNILLQWMARAEAEGPSSQI